MSSAPGYMSFRSLILSIGFVVVVLAAIERCAETRQSVVAPPHSQSDAAKGIPVRAVCREDHSTVRSTYSGDVVWTTDAKTGRRAASAVLIMDSGELDKWLERDLKQLMQDPTAKPYRPPTAVFLLADDHVLPSSGTSRSLEGNGPEYPVTCDVTRTAN